MTKEEHIAFHNLEIQTEMPDSAHA